MGGAFRLKWVGYTLPTPYLWHAWGPVQLHCGYNILEKIIYIYIPLYIYTVSQSMQSSHQECSVYFAWPLQYLYQDFVQLSWSYRRISLTLKYNTNMAMLSRQNFLLHAWPLLCFTHKLYDPCPKLSVLHWAMILGTSFCYRLYKIGWKEIAES